MRRSRRSREQTPPAAPTRGGVYARHVHAPGKLRPFRQLSGRKCGRTLAGGTRSYGRNHHHRQLAHPGPGKSRRGVATGDVLRFPRVSDTTLERCAPTRRYEEDQQRISPQIRRGPPQMLENFVWIGDPQAHLVERTPPASAARRADRQQERRAPYNQGVDPNRLRSFYALVETAPCTRPRRRWTYGDLAGTENHLTARPMSCPAPSRGQASRTSWADTEGKLYGTLGPRSTRMDLSPRSDGIVGGGGGGGGWQTPARSACAIGRRSSRRPRVRAGGPGQKFPRPDDDAGPLLRRTGEQGRREVDRDPDGAARLGGSTRRRLECAIHVGAAVRSLGGCSRAPNVQLVRARR